MSSTPSNRRTPAGSDLEAHLEFFEELGVSGVRMDPAWRERPDRGASLARLASASLTTLAPQGAIVPVSEVSPLNDLRPHLLPLAAIREDLGPCTRCKLHTLGRKQIVFGVGNPNADLMFVGEAPGADEDIQ